MLRCYCIDFEFYCLKVSISTVQEVRETLNVRNKHTTVNPHVSYEMFFMYSGIIGSHILQFNTKQTGMHFLSTVHKNDNQKCEFKELFSCKAF